MKIALIGAGPRGLLVLERLIAWQPTIDRDLTITLYDPEGIGGRVWTSTQPRELIMNTAAQHITLFYDRTVAAPAPFTPGPSLAEWAAGPARDYLANLPGGATFADEVAALTPNDYPTRGLYGVYQDWVYAELGRRAAGNVHFHLVQQMVTAVTPDSTGFTVHAANTTHVDAVVMALGNSENSLTREQQELTTYAAQHDLFYLPPNLPAEPDLAMIAPGAGVILRGLGLSFFDFVSRLTEGRGGHFSADGDRLVYHPSGREPNIVAGSRRGFPYRAKARNEKAPAEQITPRFLTPARLADWQAAGGVSGADFWATLQREVEFTYYSLLLPQAYPKLALAKFQLAFMRHPDETLKALPLAPSDRLDWSALLHPAVADAGAMAAYLDGDATDAALGSKTGPLTAALEVLRDLRDPIRQVVAMGLLSDDEYLDFFLREFVGTNDYLSIGPPLLRIRQLAALLRAGVVTLLAPGMRVTGTAGYFVASAASAPTVSYRAATLIEARVPAANAPTAANPLLQQLQHDGLATTFELQLAGERRFASGAILVDRTDSRLLDRSRQSHGKLFFWGVPTEGFNWLTTASPRPYVNDISLRQANAIARAVLDI
ncbi:FAD/NAD(P)-binding protein [Lacticaseibacillus nasuensis]|uniref:FAD(NAD)-dependent oxidoreductase n=1 Tax=Lacticaseibacillus nasuensis JCM 17158 TaxID=1291734 RepID=A0A0R1JRW1_9LACO|nr:FAD/NAD(P)-binding protein [Lacticaseibacillus nasuensis]KRK74014.1 FAD(NAD)-dependent oxidoreductase [Lacticaseibacillus nasuensis JCM 17158]